MSDLAKQAESLPTLAGVYMFTDTDGHVLYVGKSINVRDRVVSHLHASATKSQNIQESAAVSAIPVASELEALLLEAELIKKHLPKYNAAAKDDKHPLYIKITTGEKFPKITTSRKEDQSYQRARYFGPFPASTTVRQMLAQIRKIFPYCAQKNDRKPCFYSHLGLCNPCPGEIGTDKKEYMKNIKKILLLLSGKTRTLQKKLAAEMKREAAGQNFEKAAEIRNQLQKLTYITAPYTSTQEYLANPNLVWDIHQEETKTLYRILKPYFENLSLPERIECFDVSHTGGESATCSLVTFINGEPEKNLYRRFKIYGLKTRDDTAMLNQTVMRRAEHFQDWGKPDLVVVDGGKGQTSAAKQALANADSNIPVIGLAKRFEEVVIPRPFPENFKIIRLPRNNPGLKLLQRVRDEAHRFARAYHFKLRLKELLQ